MIIACETCHTRFNLDASRLKRDGSKVRCSRCKAVFIAFPPPEEEPLLEVREEFQETVALDSPVIPPEKEAAPAKEALAEIDFDQAFDEALGEKEEFKPMAPEDLRDLVAEPKEERVPRKEMGVSRRAVGEAAAEPPKPSREKKIAAEPRRRRVSVIFVLLMLFLLLCGGAAAVYFRYPQFIPKPLTFLKPGPQPSGTVDPGVRRLSFKAVTGGFLDAKSGNLFLIRGEIINNYPQSRSYLLVKASLLDEKGQPLRSKMAYAGNTLTEDQIKSRPMQEIDKALKNRVGRENRNVNVPPGASVPILIVFDNLPGNLSEFTLEAVSSSPGTK